MTTTKTSALLSFIEAHDADTLLMSRRERDAYLQLLISYVRLNGLLPDADRRLAKAAGVSLASWSTLRPELQHLFVIEGGLWRHSRLQASIERTGRDATISAARSRAAHARWEKERARKAALASPPDANPMQMHMQTDALAHANADAPSIGESQGLSPLSGLNPVVLPQTLDANAYAKAVSPSRKRRREPRAPDPMLRMFSAITGGAAAQAQAPPGWEAAHPRWCAFRVIIGETAWANTFAGCMPGDTQANTLLAPSLSVCEYIIHNYRSRFRQHFDRCVDDVVFFIPVDRRASA